MLKVLIADKTSEKCSGILESNGIKAEEKTGLSEDGLIDIIGQYDGLVVRSATKVTSRVIKASNLKVIGRAGVGVDNIDVESATEKGIVVMNSPSGNTQAAAEHTVSLIKALYRNISQADKSMKEGKWEKKKFMGTEVKGKTLGVIGFGKIGSVVADTMYRSGMNILVCDPYISAEKVKSANYTLIEDLKELLSKADCVTVHIPKPGKPLIDNKKISLMKSSAYIINVARGGIIDETALYNALKEKRIKGAALDVYEKEPLPEDSPLRSLENIILTPHLGASTEEAQENVAIDIANSLVGNLKYGKTRNAINIPEIDPEIKPYLNLAEMIGSLTTQLTEGHLKEVNVRCYGQLAKLDTRMITVAILKGLFSYVENVSYVNAPKIAQSRGVNVIEKKSEEIINYANLINIRIRTDKEERKVAGTLFDDKKPRITGIDIYKLDFIPNEYMIFLEYKDEPGVIGRIGTSLGDKGINIGNMDVGREKPKGRAMMAVNLDESVSERVIEEIRKFPDTYSVKLVKF